MVYGDLARGSTKAHNERKLTSRVTDKQSLPPGFLLASKTAQEEFAPFYEKNACPTITYTADKGVSYWDRENLHLKLERLMKSFLSDHERLPQFTIVFSLMHNEKEAFELYHVQDLIDDLIFEKVDVDQARDVDNTIEKIRVIWYVRSWDTIQRLRTSGNELHEHLAYAWECLHWMGSAHDVTVERFPALKNIELCVRYKEESYLFQYTTKDDEYVADTLFIPLATRYRDRREMVARKFPTILDQGFTTVCQGSFYILVSLLMLWLINLAPPAIVRPENLRRYSHPAFIYFLAIGADILSFGPIFLRWIRHPSIHSKWPFSGRDYYKGRMLLYFVLSLTHQLVESSWWR